MGTIDQYAVIGHPIAHSKSPDIHQMFAEQTGEQLEYSKIDVDEPDFESFVREFFALPEDKGLNVTVPFKERAWALAEAKSERAALAGAVNTLWLKDGQLYGDNTDGVGLVHDLKWNHSVGIRNANILIIGAGGAVRGVLQPILNENPLSITIANRTVSKAQALVELFGHLGQLNAASFEELDQRFDLIINGSSASLQGEIPDIDPVVIGPTTVVYDMMYCRDLTVFNRWAHQHGARQTLDGLGMLVEQAAEAFRLWHGVLPDTASVIAHLRAKFINS